MNELMQIPLTQSGRQCVPLPLLLLLLLPRRRRLVLLLRSICIDSAQVCHQLRVEVIKRR